MSADKDVVFQIGRWSICRQGSLHYLLHQCEKEYENRSSVAPRNYSRWSQNPRRIPLRWRCYGCHKQPPDSILGVYKLLETDCCVAEEALVQKHLK